MPSHYHHHAAALAQESPLPGQSLRLRVNGKSMSPLLLPGDMLTVWCVTAHEIQPGDILVVQDSGGFLTHRLLAVIDGQLLTKGDALALPDLPIPAAQLVGRVQIIEREGKASLDCNRKTWQRAQSWLARLSWLEGRIMARFYRAPYPANKFQKCIAHATTLPLRGLAFLLQWGMRITADRNLQQR